jgi:hypothetical protein
MQSCPSASSAWETNIIPWSVLKYNANLGGYVVHLDKRWLEGAPAYDVGDEPAWGDRAYESKIHDSTITGSGLIGLCDCRASQPRLSGVFLDPEVVHELRAQGSVYTRPAGSCGLHLNERQCERPALPQKLRAPVPPGFRGTWRIQSLEHRAQLANGSRCGQSWSSRSYTTT